MKKIDVSHLLSSVISQNNTQLTDGVKSMGKYMKKANTTGDVALLEAPQSSSLGVCTRAKTLAIQRRLQSFAAALPPSKPDSCYLELRSRRLEKPPLLRRCLQRKSRTPVLKQGVVCAEEENPKPENTRFGSGLITIELSEKEDGCFERHSGGQFEVGDSEIEACFGENSFDMETRGRSTRESTPCNLIMAADNITTPGSTTKQRTPIANQNAQNALRNIPTSREMEDFFTQAENSQQQHFIQKYNFDVVHEKPLPGRYEWVKVIPKAGLSVDSKAQERRY